MSIVHITDLDMRMYAGRPRRFALYKCTCCGKEFEHCTANVARTKSCGCARDVRPINHGDARKKSVSEYRKLYRAFVGIHQRCSNAKSTRFSRYGGRGICVCDEWSIYAVFKEWAIKNGWAEGLQIDRIDNDGNYCPENCRWTTREENLKNRDLSRVGMHARKLDPDKVAKIRSGVCARELAKDFGVSESLIYMVMRGDRWT